MSNRLYSFPAGYADYRALAEQRLPRFLFDYIDGGASSEYTLAANSKDFAKLVLRQRVLKDVSQLSTRTELFGQALSMPLALAPLGMAGLMARRGEVQAAKAAANAGIPFCLSTVGICAIEEVNTEVPRPSWFQLYMLRDRDVVNHTLERAQQAGSDTLLFTVDLPVAGIRQRDTRNGMLANNRQAKLAKALQLMARPQWLWDVGVKGKPHSFGNLSDQVSNPKDLQAFKAWVDAQFDPSVTWQDLQWVREQWPGKLIIKGVLDAEDAQQAIDSGADAVLLSNHGGRQLDSVPSTISQLPQIAAAVAGQVPLLLDGGVRNGVDVLKAIALGAQAVLIGRPWAMALAGAGQQGLENYLAELQQELAIAMALCGVKHINEINTDVLHSSNLQAIVDC